MAKSKSTQKHIVAPTAGLMEFDSEEAAAQYLMEQRDAGNTDLALIIGEKTAFKLTMTLSIEKAKRAPRKKKADGQGESTPTTPRRGRTPAADAQA
jgi:hypothetical protein